MKHFPSWPLEAEEVYSLIKKVGTSRCGTPTAVTV